MSESTVRIITGLVLIFHGIGYGTALIPALNLFSSENWHHRSWLLTNSLGDTVSRAIVVILFGAIMLGFITAGLAVFGWLIPHDWWQALAIVSAVLGLIALALFWNAFASLFPNKIGAIVVNVIVLWALLGSNSLSKMVVNI